MSESQVRDFENVPVDDSDVGAAGHLRTQDLYQMMIKLDGHDLARKFRQAEGKRAQTRTNFNDNIVRAKVSSASDAIEHTRVRKKALPQTPLGLQAM
jgi:hypothetical protein